MKVDRREQLGLICGFVALLMVVFMLAYIPLDPHKRYEDSRQKLTGLQRQLSIIQLLLDEEKQRVQSQEKFMRLLQERDKRFEIFAFMNRVLSETDLLGRAQLETLRSRRLVSDDQPRVRLQLRGVSLEELINLLHKVYSSENLVVVQKADLRPAANDKGLNCDLTFVTVKV